MNTGAKGLDAQRWERIGTIFDAVAEATLEQREALLARMCGDDAELRHEVDALLRADSAGTGFERDADSARGVLARDWSETGETLCAGERIGPWRIEHELGRGGMGVVLLVERADGQFTQRAALKLIKRGMDSEAVLARFLRERQILARLEHPHIAHLLDGGIAGDGRPYFVMEYVEGESLLPYCERTKASLENRARLFLDICAAVQFAHGQLIVHRDIKPSNILVTPNGSAKLLDFGIAKWLADEDEQGGYATATMHDRALTPAYAAPEQLRGEPVTIATDVYALGCVLYELLTDRRPFDLGSAPTLEEARRIVETTTPVVPSTRASRQTPVPHKRLRGDLDTIVLTALQREPARRYATVSALAEDLQRHLGGRPILARRDSTLYRTRKFVTRHVLGVAASTAAVAALLVTTGMSFHEARTAQAESARADQRSKDVAAENDFLLSTFESANPFNAKGATVTARELLEKTAGRIDGEFADQPSVSANLHVAMGDIYFANSRYAQAQQHYQAAHDALARFKSADDPLVLATQVSVFEQRLYQHDIVPVIAPLEQIVRDTAEPGPAYADVHRSASATLMDALRDTGNYARAAQIGEQMVAEDAHQAVAKSEQRRSYSKFSLSGIALDQENLVRATELIAEVTAKDDANTGPVHFGEIFHLRVIADLLLHLGRANEAQMLYSRLQGLGHQAAEIQSPYLAKDTAHEGMALLLLGDYASAHTTFLRAAGEHRETFHDETLVRSNCSDARALIGLGLFDEAEQRIDSALAAYQEWGIPDHPSANACREAQMEIPIAHGGAMVQARLLAIANAQRVQVDGELPYSLLTLARVAHTHGDDAAGQSLLDETLHVLARQGRPWHPFAYTAYLQRAKIAAADGDAARSRDALVHALSSAVMAFSPTHARTQEILVALGANDDAARQALLSSAAAAAGQPPAEFLYQRALRILARADAPAPAAATTNSSTQ